MPKSAATKLRTFTDDGLAKARCNGPACDEPMITCREGSATSTCVMEFLSQTYVALRGPTGIEQTPADTIGKLSDRLSPATLLADRRAAVFSLKGLARDCKQNVGERAILGLLEVLAMDADADANIGKAVLETLDVLCDADERDGTPLSKELGLKHTDLVLSNEQVVHTLFSLLSDASYHVQLATLQLLSTLLLNRRQVVQQHFVTAPAGTTSIMKALDNTRDIIRHETISTIQLLISGNPNVQNVLTFEGVFEKLFKSITQDGGLEGGVPTQLALQCVHDLLLYNPSNQSYFRETTLPLALCSLLLFPPDLELAAPPPQEFSLQFWDKQKLANASSVIRIMGTLLGSKAGGTYESSAFARCLIELGLSSNVSTSLKALCLRLLPQRLNFPLSDLSLTQYMPVPETNGEEWDRLEAASALDVLVELALHGEFRGAQHGNRSRDDLELRAAAATVFEKFVQAEDIKVAILRGMIPSEVSGSPPLPPLLHALISPSCSPLDIVDLTSTHFSALLFAHLLRSSRKAKSLALSITPPSLPTNQESNPSPPIAADGDPSPPIPPGADGSNEHDPPRSLLEILTENLSLSLLARSRANTSERESRDHDRLVIAYVSLLSQWLWEDPHAVRQFLDVGGFGLLVDAINQKPEVDAIVPGMCAFLLGICYRSNLHPGEITRTTIYSLMNRLGIDTLSGHIAGIREDDRFKDIRPDSIVLPYLYPYPAHMHGPRNEGEIWFDWPFVDFWKSNCYAIQLVISSEPASITTDSGDENTPVASLRDVIRSQAQEIQALQEKLAQQPNVSQEVLTLQSEAESLLPRLQSSEDRRRELEKEQEDLLLLLEEVTIKRKKDKEQLRNAGLEVSDDETD